MTMFMISAFYTQPKGNMDNMGNGDNNDNQCFLTQKGRRFCRCLAFYLESSVLYPPNPHFNIRCTEGNNVK